MIRILIPNYAQYQHYRDRNPPWIKIHKRILDDRKFMQLRGKEQSLLIMLWVLASENPLDEGRGVVKLEDLSELAWRLREHEATMSGGGSSSLNLLMSRGFIEIEGDSSAVQADASKALATRNPEGEREGEREGEGEVHPSGPSGSGKGKLVKKSWAREAAEDWDAAFGKGSCAPGRIGAALTPLVKNHGWEKVRPAWQRYLEERDPTFANPQDFAAKFKVWSEGTAHRVGGAAIESENKREVSRFLDGEKRLRSEPAQARILPPKDR